jgi:hypothetical protein
VFLYLGEEPKITDISTWRTLTDRPSDWSTRTVRIYAFCHISRLYRVQEVTVLTNVPSTSVTHQATKGVLSLLVDQSFREDNVQSLLN